MSHSTTKPTKWPVCPAKTQISLGIRPVWSESSLSTGRNIGSLATHWAHSKDSDQPGHLGRCPGWSESSLGARHFVGFVMRWLKCLLLCLQTSLSLNFYAPSFEEVDAYWFRVMLPSVHPSVPSRTAHARVLKFNIWIPHGKYLMHILFLVRIVSLSGVMPLWKNLNEIWCMPYLMNCVS